MSRSAVVAWRLAMVLAITGTAAGCSANGSHPPMSSPSIEPAPARLEVTASAAVFAAPLGDQRHASFVLTVRNTGNANVEHVSVQLLLARQSPIIAFSSQCPEDAVAKVPNCVAGDLVPGASRTFDIMLSLAVDDVDAFLAAVPDGRPGQLRVLIGDREYGVISMPKAILS